MLANKSPLRKFKLFHHSKKSKVDPVKESISLEDLASLVRRLSVQIEDLETKSQTEQENKKALNHTIIDPWASCVPQNYAGLLQRLEDVDMLQKCPNECCANIGTVGSAEGIPWPKPIEPFQTTNQDILDTQYAHWCTLMRCLPLMDAVTSAHVRTIGLYALREILKSKANQKQETTCFADEPTTTKLRESMNCLAENPTLHYINTALPHPPPPPPVPPKETTTPLPSELPSPLLTHNRFNKWLKYKKLHKKTNTDTATTPMHQSQTLRKIGSWFF